MRPIPSKQEIEEKLSQSGDYVKLDYLQRLLKSGIDFDTRKFVLTKLAHIYEDKGMYMEAAKMVKNAAEINSTFRGKLEDYMKAVELLIRGNCFDDADVIFSQALALSNERQKLEAKETLKNYYFAHAENMLRKDKRTQAKKTYEKMMKLGLDTHEEERVRKELMNLYQKLGNVREYMKMSKS